VSELKKFASDIGVTFFASMVAMLLTFPISVLLGRSLGVEELGLYRMVSTIFGTWGLFASFGIPSAMIKYVSEYSDETETQERIISSGVSSSLILGFISFFLIFVLSGFFANLFHMPELSPLLKILAFVFPFFVLNEVLLAIIRGFREMTKNAWATITQNVLLLFFTLLLVFKYNLEGVIIAIVISSFLTTFILLHIHKWRNISLPHDLALSKQIFVFGSKNLLSNAINLINYQADILMIGYFLSKYDVGIYSVAVMFGKLIWILPDSIQAVTYPTISELYSRKRYGDINILVNRCMKFSCIFLLLSNSFFVFFGKQFIGFIYGSEFEASYISLIILLVGTVFYGITKSVGSNFCKYRKSTSCI
jgi:stage V sporulation protein B